MKHRPLKKTLLYGAASLVLLLALLLLPQNPAAAADWQTTPPTYTQPQLARLLEASLAENRTAALAPVLEHPRHLPGTEGLPLEEGASLPANLSNADIAAFTGPVNLFVMAEAIQARGFDADFTAATRT